MFQKEKLHVSFSFFRFLLYFVHTYLIIRIKIYLLVLKRYNTNTKIKSRKKHSVFSFHPLLHGETLQGDKLQPAALTATDEAANDKFANVTEQRTLEYRVTFLTMGGFLFTLFIEVLGLKD